MYLHTHTHTQKSVSWQKLSFNFLGTLECNKKQQPGECFTRKQTAECQSESSVAFSFPCYLPPVPSSVAALKTVACRGMPSLCYEPFAFCLFVPLSKPSDGFCLKIRCLSFTMTLKVQAMLKIQDVKFLCLHLKA